MHGDRMQVHGTPAPPPLPPGRAGWLLYDGACGICSHGVARAGGHLDRIGLHRAALQEPWVAHRLGADGLLDDLALLLADGQILRGAQAYRWVLARRWWTWPLWAVAATPPTRWLWDVVYRLIARHRHGLAAACGLRPR
jgi:predicted DCC family thiol-disulfide oxidoreductase YuxK